MKDLRLSEIYIYPIKSLGGIRLKKAKVLEKGLEFDRRWMLVDRDGKFMTQRIHPKMALLKVSLGHGEISVVNHARPERPSIRFFADQVPSGKHLYATIWDDAVTVTEVDSDLSAWFSKELEMDCRLVVFPESNTRPVDARYKVNDENVSLADAYPFLVIGQSSLDDLNTRLKEPVPMNRFRPNFVVTGSDPYEEDRWRKIRIGQNRFIAVKPCSRCVLTTVNQDTGEKGIEPLATLSSYRKIESKVNFGQNLVATDHEHVSEGDRIVIETTTN